MQKPSSRPTIPGSPSRRTLIAAAVCGAPFTVGAAGAAAAPARPGPELAPPAEVQPGAAGYEHPGLLHTASDLEEMSVRVESGASPWAQGYERLAANGHAGADWQARPLQTVVRGGDGQNYMQLALDIHTAYQNALRWRLTGAPEHGAAAVGILNGWASTLSAISGNADRFLAAGIYGYQLANAAELLHDHPELDKAGVQDLLLQVFYPLNDDFLTNHNDSVITNYWANWDLCTMASVLAIGVFTDREDLVDRAVTYFQDGEGNGSILHAIPFVYDDENLAQWQESGRDQGHSIMGIGLMAAFCEMAWSQGIDCWGHDDNRFLKAAEYVAKYNLGHDVPFTEYTWQSGPSSTPPHVGWQTHTEISGTARGQQRPVWELILAHYAGRRGLEAPWVEEMVGTLRPEGGGGDYGDTSGGYDQLGFGTLSASA